MPKVTTRTWDPANYLRTTAARAAYLEAALQDGDPNVVAAALGDIARAAGMTRIAEQTGLGRESLYKALRSEGNPEFATVLRVLDATGLRLRAVARDRNNRAKATAPARTRPRTRKR